MVDSRQRFVGMVSRLDLLRWVQFQLYGGRRGKDMTISEIFYLVSAQKVKDLQTRNMRLFSVQESDTLQAALDLMVDYEENILPVLDGEGRIIGDLSLSEVLLKAIEVGKQSKA
jgi:CBS domain-containing protein